MPNSTGGDSSSIDYEPHMWVLAEGGDSTKDDDYIFVGNATAYYREPDTEFEYHVGVTALGELVGNVTRGRGNTSGLATEEIPEAAKNKLIKVGLSQISTLAGHVILSGLGVEIPTDLGPLDFEKVFNGTPEEQASEVEKRDQWQEVANQLRQTLVIE